MSDAPLGPDWWLAGDGKWYPAPPGLSDATPSRAPTPAPDHDPEPPVRRAPLAAGVYGAGRVGAPPPPTPARRSRGRVIAVGTALVLIVVAVLAGVTVLVSDHSSKQASSNDPEYQQAIVDLLASERTNIVFLQTFWEDYRAHVSGAGSLGQQAPSTNGTPASKTVDPNWMPDMQAQVSQFSQDLAAIDEDLDARPYDDGSVADTIRDEAQAHYRTWQEWARNIPTIIERWIADTSTLSLSGYMEEFAPHLDASIERTFRALCTTLRETAPSDGKFDQTIESICHD